VDGWPHIAALDFPLLGEHFTAQIGKGAFLNGEKLLAKPPLEDQPTSFFSCCSRTFRHYQVSVRYKTRILGSAAYGLVSVARGSAVLAFEATPKVWDFAASWLIMHEAGGFVQALDGSELFPLIPGTEYRDKNYPTLAAATLAEIERGRQQITPN
jgi:myo-inositol-1(or 4)-monophosphatase